MGEIFNCPVRVLGAGRYQSISIELFDATLQKWCGSENPHRAVTARRATGIACARTLARNARQRALCGLSGVLFLLRTAMRVMRDLIKQHRSPMELMTICGDVRLNGLPLMRHPRRQRRQHSTINNPIKVINNPRLP